MYQPLGNLYAEQRLGAFESDGAVFEKTSSVLDRILGRHQRRGKSLKQLSNEQLASMLAEVESRKTKATGEQIARLEKRSAAIKAEIASRKPAGFGAFSMPTLCSPLGLGVLAAAGVGAYWFLVRPRMSRRKR